MTSAVLKDNLKNKIFKFDDLERQLLLIKKNGLGKLTSTLSRGSKVGTSLLTINIDPEPLRVSAFSNTDLSENLGDYVLGLKSSYTTKTKNPIKRGNFIQHRNGIVNVSPIGRSCTLSERKDFYDKDNTHKWREDLITRIKNKWVKYKWFNNYENLTDLDFSIGGQISIDIFPVGWDKTFCLSFVKNEDSL